MANNLMNLNTWVNPEQSTSVQEPETPVMEHSGNLEQISKGVPKHYDTSTHWDSFETV